MNTRSARRAQRAPFGLLPFQLSWLALAQWHGGHWPAAYSNAHDAIALAEETGWRTELPNSLVALATIEAGWAGPTAAVSTRRARSPWATGARVWPSSRRTRRSLSRCSSSAPATRGGRHATWSSSAAFAAEHGLGDPVLLNWAGDLVEALDRAGEPERAWSVCEVVAAEAARTRRPTEVAVAARCRGLLAEDEQAAGTPSPRRSPGTRGRPSRSRKLVPGCSTVSCCGVSGGGPTRVPSWARPSACSSGSGPSPGPPGRAASCGPPASPPGRAASPAGSS